MKPKYLLHFFFVFLVLLNNCHSKYFKYDEDHWNHILISLNHKEGRLPPYIRSTTSRSSFKDINLTKEFEEVHKNMNYYSSIEDGQRFEENSNIKLKNNEIKHFHKAIENIKNQINQTYNPNIGQRMRGESAKKLYVAQTIKHDTVDGYNSKINQKKDNSSISVKKSEIYILKSMPKKNPKKGPTFIPQSSTFRKYVSNEEKSRRFVERKEPKENEPYWNIGGGDGEDDVTIEWCRFARKNYSVVPDESWGSLPPKLQKLWSDYHCNNYFLSKRLNKRPLVLCNESNYDNRDKPLIAILVATTSRTVYRPAITNLSLFQLLFKSMIRSLDCGYRYLVVVGYDKGDIFFDTKPGLELTKLWFENNVMLPLKLNSVDIALELVLVTNDLQKPGPVFNAVARVAYKAGANFLYRVNDDTEFVHHWPHAYATTLQNLSPPFGVIGPYTVGKNNRILTIDFVHRVHMNIFQMNYYPEELPDWWMDDWITHIYGPNRSYLSRRIVVMHHTQAHGKRYSVDFENEKKLLSTLEYGRKLIRRWMKRHNSTKDEIQEFVNLPLPDVTSTAIITSNFQDLPNN